MKRDKYTWKEINTEAKKVIEFEQKLVLLYKHTVCSSIVLNITHAIKEKVSL